mgnify:CR=1 FL=1
MGQNQGGGGRVKPTSSRPFLTPSTRTGCFFVIGSGIESRGDAVIAGQGESGASGPPDVNEGLSAYSQSGTNRATLWFEAHIKV